MKTLNQFLVLPSLALALLLATGASATTYINKATGNWSAGGSWSAGGPSSGGASDTVIQFSPTGNDNSTNDLAGAFWLNQLLLVPNQTVTVYTPSGNYLLFTNTSGGVLPVLTNAGTSTLTINSAITLATNLTVGATSSGAITINSNITESTMSALTKTGANTLTLNSANTFSGGLNILNGTVAVGVSLATNWLGTGTITLGDSSGANNASLYASITGAGDLFSNAVVVAAGSSGTLSILAANAYLTFSGPLALNNNLTLNPGNTGKAAAFSGTITETSLNSPALTVTSTNGFAVLSGGLVVGSGGLTFAHNSTAGILTIGPGNVTGSGNLTFNANNSAAITVSAVSINPSGGITNSGTGTNTTTISGGIGGNVTNIVQNSATSALKLSGANSAYPNHIFVNAGTLNLSGATSLTSTNLVTMSAGGILDVEANVTIAGLQDGTGAGVVTNAGNASHTLTLGGSGSCGFGGSIGDGFSGGVRQISLTQSGTGTQTLSGANAYGGATTVNGGVLKIESNTGLGYGGVNSATVAGATVTPSGTGITTATLDLNGTVTVNKPLTLNGTTTGGDTAVLVNSATSSTATLNNGVAGVSFTSGGSNYKLADTLSFSGGGGSGAAASLGFGLGAGTVTVFAGGSGWTNGNTITVSGGNSYVSAVYTVTGPAAGQSAGSITALTLTSAGAGFTTLTGLTFTGGKGSATTTFAGTGANFNTVDGTLTVSGISMTVAGSGYATAPAVSISLSSGSTGSGFSGAALLPALTLVNTQNQIGSGSDGNLTVNCPVTGPGGGFTKAGSSTLTLAGMNTYTGNTTVVGGTLAIQQPTLPATATVTVTNGGVLELDFAVTNSVTNLVLNGVSVTGVHNNSTDPTCLHGTGSLLVAASIATNPTNISFTVTGGTNLNLSWPLDHLGWLVQSNAINLGVSSDWYDISNTAAGANYSITMNPANTNVFYRLRKP